MSEIDIIVAGMRGAVVYWIGIILLPAVLLILLTDIFGD